jgi:UPF0755 protein
MTSRFWALLAFIVALAALGGGFLAWQKQQVKQARQKQLESQIKPREEISLTFIEGWSISEIGEYLEKQGLGSKEAFLEAEKEFDFADFRKIAAKPKNAGLEGYVFPDTYRIFKPEAKDSNNVFFDVLKKALSNFEKKVTDQMVQDAKKHGLKNLHEAVILASIVENETGRNAVTSAQKQALDEERKIVAGIFYNRLSAGMALQSDATVNYATGKNLPSPTLDDLEVNSPYNTYKHRGLPPGPISNPSLSSLMAAIYPAETDYLYFLHKQPSGEPVYSKTFEEHVANKLKYLK